MKPQGDMELLLSHSIIFAPISQKRLLHVIFFRARNLGQITVHTNTIRIEALPLAYGPRACNTYLLFSDARPPDWPAIDSSLPPTRRDEQQPAPLMSPSNVFRHGTTRSG